MNSSASRSRASRLLARSLSITASTPTRCRSSPGAYIVGIPPPPAQMITTPWSSSQRIGRSSKIRSGRGEGTTRRQFGAVRLDRPALVRGQRLRRRLVVDRTDELGRIPERGVVGIDLDHGQDGRQRHLEREARCRAPARACIRSCPGSQPRGCPGDRARHRGRPPPGGRAARPAARCHGTRSAGARGPPGPGPRPRPECWRAGRRPSSARRVSGGRCRPGR